MRQNLSKLIVSCAMVTASSGLLLAQKNLPSQKTAKNPNVQAGDAADPFGARQSRRIPSPKKAKSDEGENRTAPMAKLSYFVFSLPMKEAAALQRKGLDDSKHFEEMRAGVSRGDFKQEKLSLAIGRSGTMLSTKSVVEFNYPTEFRPPVMPATMGGVTSYAGKSSRTNDPEDVVFPATPATPTSFDTKLLGDMLQCEIEIDQSGQQANARISPSHVSKFADVRYGSGVSMVKMPRFSLQQLTTGLTIGVGKPTYLGTVSPPSELMAKGEKTTWQAFVILNLEH